MNRLKFKTLKKISDHSGEIEKMPRFSSLKKRKMSTCNRLNLETVGSQPIMPSNLPRTCIPLLRTHCLCSKPLGCSSRMLEKLNLTLKRLGRADPYTRSWLDASKQPVYGLVRPSPRYNSVMFPSIRLLYSEGPLNKPQEVPSNVPWRGIPNIIRESGH